MCMNNGTYYTREQAIKKDRKKRRSSCHLTAPVHCLCGRFGPVGCIETKMSHNSTLYGKWRKKAMQQKYAFCDFENNNSRTLPLATSTIAQWLYEMLGIYIFNLH